MLILVNFFSWSWATFNCFFDIFVGEISISEPFKLLNCWLRTCFWTFLLLTTFALTTDDVTFACSLFRFTGTSCIPFWGWFFSRAYGIKYSISMLKASVCRSIILMASNGISDNSLGLDEASDDEFISVTKRTKGEMKMWM